SRGQPPRLWDDDYVSALQQHVLFEVAAAYDIVEAKWQCNLPAISAPEHKNIVRRCERGGSSGDAECLHDIVARFHHEFTRVVDMSEHVDLVAVDLANGHGDDDPGDVTRKAVGDFLPQLLDRFTDGIEITGQREREPAVGPDEHLLIE